MKQYYNGLMAISLITVVYVRRYEMFKFLSIIKALIASGLTALMASPAAAQEIGTNTFLMKRVIMRISSNIRCLKMKKTFSFALFKG